MNTIPTCFPNLFVSLGSSYQALNEMRNRSDKTTQIAMVATIALAIFVIIAIRYAEKLKNWIQKPLIRFSSQVQKDLLKVQKASYISMDRAKKIGHELDYVIQKSKSENDLIDYFRVCPNVDSIRLYDCSISKKLFEKIPKNVKVIILSGCHLFDHALEGLNVLSIKTQTLSLHLENCTLKNIISSHRLNHLSIESCNDISLANVSAKSCSIRHCKNFSINNPTGNMQALAISHCDSFSLDLLPKTLERLSLMLCKKIVSLDYLPDTIKSLRIIDCGFKNLSLNHLPKKLENLTLYGDLTGQTLDHLPANLQTLDLRTQHLPLLDQLPQGLKVIKFRSRDLNLPLFDHLPQGLKAIEFRCCDLTNISLTSLPDHLTSVTFIYCTGISLANLPSKLKNIIHKDSRFV